jgi:hypothetical protein
VNKDDRRKERKQILERKTVGIVNKGFVVQRKIKGPLRRP